MYGDTMVSDARGLPAEALVDLRRRVVAAVQAGASQTHVAQLFGVSRQTVGAWVRDYRDHGDSAFRPGRRGRRPGEQLALIEAQQLWVARTVARRTPDELGMPYLVWTRQAVAELVNREFRVMLGVTTIGNYLVRWGYPGPQELLRSLRDRNAAAVADPLRSPAAGTWIAGAEAIWVGYLSTEWTVGGSAPPAPRPGWPDLGMVQAVSNRGALYFLACRDPFDCRQLCAFLDLLIGQVRRRVNVVVCWQPTRNRDGLPDWLAGNLPNAAVRFLG